MLRRWLFVTYTPVPKRPILDASARYRCFSRVEDLVFKGHRAAIISQQRFERDPPLDCDFYVFHRPWYSQDFEGLLEFLRRRGKRIVADYDAPVFAEPLRGGASPPFAELGHGSGTPVQVFQRALHLFEQVTCASRELADWIAEVHPESRIQVIADGLSRSWIHRAKFLYGRRTSDEAQVCVDPGPAFDPDIPLTRRVLGRALQDDSSLQVIAGRKASLELDLPEGRTRTWPERGTKLSVLSRCDRLLIPATDSRVNRCNSAITAIEALFMGCRVTAPPLPECLLHESMGIDIARSEDEWISILSDSAKEPLPTGLPERLEVEMSSKTGTDTLAEFLEP